VSFWSSNTNAVLTDQCQALGDVMVSLTVTDDLVTYGDSGFSLQLNAYPISGTTCVGQPMDWIQYVLQVNNLYGNNTAAFQWQAWSLESTAWSGGEPQGMGAGPTQPVPKFSQPNSVITNVPNNQLPTGSSLTIALTTDPSTYGVTQATFSVQLPGAGPQSVTVDFPASIPFTFTTGEQGTADAQFPIGGFQLNLVGPDGSNATFISGAGVLNYFVPAGSSLSVQNGPVGAACGQYPFAFTGETSNIVYGPIGPPTAIPIFGAVGLNQPFGVFGGAKTLSALSPDAVYVIGSDGNLWLEQAPFGTLPPNRTPGPVDANAMACSGVDANTVFVVGSDHNFWIEHAPFGPGNIPPLRTLVYTDALGCSAVDANTVYFLDSAGDLWLDKAPFLTLAADLTWVASAVGCSAVDASTVYALDGDGNLWLEQAPFGTVPPAPVDSNVVGCSAVDASTVYVLNSDGNLFLEQAPFPNPTPVDSNVVGCSAVDASTVYVLDSDGNLWLERAPFGNIPPLRTPVDANVML
jgi:hypothetical protein